MNNRMFQCLMLSGLLLVSHPGCAQDATDAKDHALAEIEVARAEVPNPDQRFNLDKDDREYNFYTQAWSGKLPKSIGSMSSDEAADFVLKFVSDNFASFNRQSLTQIESSPITEQASQGPARRVGWFVDIVQVYKGARLGHLRSTTKRQGGIHAMLNDMPEIPGQDKQGPSVSVDLIVWKVVREHGEAKPVLSEKRVKDILLKDFVGKYPYAKGQEVSFTYLDLAYVPKEDDPERWVPRWLAEISAPHPGPYSPNNPMKPTIHSYAVDAWTGKILESQQELVPVAPVGPADVLSPRVLSPPVEDSTKKTSNEPDAGDDR